MAEENASTAASVPAPASGQGTYDNVAPQNAHDLEPLPLDGEDLEADNDSAYGETLVSSSTSFRPSIAKGLIENGRRYQVSRDTDINIPSDEKQFDSMEAAHSAYTVIESQQDNPCFRSKLALNAQHIIDLGTGQGSWAIAVAGKFSNITVHGVDLYQPPQQWVPPNCIFEVDDVTKPWTWDHKFDLAHLRAMSGTLSTDGYKELYKTIYNKLAPGGWIEHVDVNTAILCDDGSMPKDFYLAKFATEMQAAVAQTGNDMHVTELMRSGIEEAGFTKICERDFKFPIGDWPKHPVYKDSGALYKKMHSDGMEGWPMYLLTRFGLPQPWTPEEVAVYVAKLKKELDHNWHIYQGWKRVWAQKPYGKKEVQEPSVHHLASGTPSPTQPRRRIRGLKARMLPRRLEKESDSAGLISYMQGKMPLDRRSHFHRNHIPSSHSTMPLLSFQRVNELHNKG